MASKLEHLVLQGDEEPRIRFNATAAGYTLRIGFQEEHTPYDHIETSYLTYDRHQIIAIRDQLELAVEAIGRQLKSEET